MNTRRFLAACTLVSLPLALPHAAAQAAPAQVPAAPAADTPAVALVRAFLADRAAGKYDAAYALLSSAMQKDVTENQFAAGQTPPAAPLQEQGEPIYALAILFTDPRNTQGYTFTLTGPDPANPNAALVRAVPPASHTGVPPTVLHLAVSPDLVAHAPRLDMVETLKGTDPKMFAQVTNNAKRASSQSNLKQIGLGIIQYTQDHDENMPDAAKWVDEIMPYVQSKELFHDPSTPESQSYGYAYNSALSHKGLAVFLSPSETVMVFESTKGVKNSADTGVSVPRPGRYNGGTDYLFADGHVKWVKDGTKPSFKLTGK